MVENMAKSSVTLKRTATMKDGISSGKGLKTDETFKIYTSKEGAEALTELMIVRDMFDAGTKPTQPDEDNKPKTFAKTI